MSPHKEQTIVLSACVFVEYFFYFTVVTMHVPALNQTPLRIPNY